MGVGDLGFKVGGFRSWGLGALLIAWIILRLKGLIFPGLRGPKTVLGHDVEPQGCGLDFKVPCFGVELRELAPVLSASEQPERKDNMRIAPDYERLHNGHRMPVRDA